MRILYKLETLFPTCAEWQRAGILTPAERTQLSNPPNPEMGISKPLRYEDVLHETIHEYFCPEYARGKFITANLGRREDGRVVIADAMFFPKTDILDSHDAQKFVLAPWSLAEDMHLNVNPSAYEDDLTIFRKLLRWVDDEEEVQHKIKEEIRAEAQPQHVRDAIHKRAQIVFGNLQKYAVYPK